VEYWAAAFDSAARRHPEGSVALYSLGDPVLLAAATGEIVDRLGEWGCLPANADCLDIGCGIGRFEVALAGRVRRIVGIDIAPAMVEIARERTAALPNVEIRAATGRDLGGFADSSFDLVLAADVFPYLVQSGLAATMIGEAGRVLRQGGRLVILNYSYRGDPNLDRTELGSQADGSGLTIVRNGTAEFRLWDGLAFEMSKG
jgi:SAM-dependent methyltransferase